MAAGDRLPFHLYRAASLTARTLPGPLATAAGRALGLPLAGALRSRRLMVARHQQRVRPDLRGPALRRAVQRSFDSYARYWVESFRLADLTPAQLAADIETTGVEHLEAAVADGRGAIAVLPHLGAWDFGGAYLASRGFRITVVVEQLEPPELFEWFVEMRRRLGLNVVGLGPEAGKATLAALKRGEVVGLVADRDLAGTGVEVDFFGERTTLPGGPATLALRTGAPILPMAIYYEEPWARGPAHRGVVRPPLPIERQGPRLRDDVARVTQQVADALAELIAEAPEQWHLLQPNWPSDHEALRRWRVDH